MKGKKSLWMSVLLLIAAVCFVLAACTGGNTVKLKFETNGGAPIEAVELEKGTQYELPTPVWDEAHSFEGWYTDSAFTEGPVTTVTAESNQTFYAKWTELAVITLNLDGGTLADAVGGKLYLKAGANVASFMESYKPAKEGYEFGEWLAGDSALSRTATMPAEGITLTAHYKVGYTVETYLQSLDLTTYERGEDITGFEYAGVNLTPDVSVHGFHVTDNENADTTKTIGATPAENVFKFYFDREEYAVIFQSNYPAELDLANTNDDRSYLYGTKAELPVDLFTLDGYVLVGWAKTAAGGVEYAAGYIESLLYNGDKSYEPASFTIENDTMLYAVWSKGYTDIFGGSDLIFLLEQDARDIYLFRGGVFFKGEYNARSATFSFITKDIYNRETVVVQGKLSTASGTYTYYNESRDGFTMIFFEMGVGFDAYRTLHLDAYNGFTYIVDNVFGWTTEHTGTYTINEDGYYVLTFDSGNYAGKVWTVARRNAEINGVITPVFQIRNEEEYEMGSLVRGVVYNGVLTYYTSALFLTLDGFGFATLNTGSSDATYYYVVEGDTVTLMTSIISSDSATAAVYRLMEIGGAKAYMPYTASLDGEFTATNGATLTLDGVCNATYKVGGATYTGVYSYQSSYFGGYVITLTANGGTSYTFLTSTVESTVTNDDGSTTTTVNRTFAQRQSGYAEYYYSQGDSSVDPPLFVFNETEEGMITVYGRTAARTFEKIAYGSYTYNPEYGTYLFTVSQRFDAEVTTDVIDMSTVQSVVFSLGTRTISLLGLSVTYPVHYWHSYTTTGGETVGYATVYTAADGSTFTVTAGYATYKSGATLLTGTYTTYTDGITVFTSGSTTLYFELYESEEGNTLLLLDDLLGTAIAALANGDGSLEITLVFNGKGGVIYTDEDKNTYEGTYSRTDKVTAFGSYVYKFTSDDVSFEFILFSGSNYTYFARYNEEVNGEYVSADREYLTLDGYSYTAEYANLSGSVKGYYYIVEENVICMIVGNYALYFDITADKTFTMRGMEYGTYAVMDNNYFGGFFVTLDGYGHLTVFTFDDEGEQVEIDADGTYALTTRGVELYFMNGNEETTLIGALGTYTTSSGYLPVFVVAHTEVVRHYVNANDLTVLALDSYGTAIKYCADGTLEYGTYLLVTSTMLYYVNSDGTDACIYEYDVEAGTVNQVNFSPRGYYTENLEALLFTRYGFMIMDGETRYYYNVASNGDVYIYRQGEEGEAVNEYGFVEENFGRFTDSKEINGKTYYANDGFDLSFSRVNKEKYPLLIETGEVDEEGNPVTEPWYLEQLTFTPGGGSNFTVSGTVVLNGTRRTCYITRSVLEDGTLEMYVTVGYYRFYIDLTYKGDSFDSADANVYEVTGLSLYIELPSETFLYNYLMYYMYTGMLIRNSFGLITIVTEFDEFGMETADYVSGVFGVNSGMVDSEGNLVSFEKLDYKYENNLYVVEFVGNDGYLYRVRFAMMSSQYMSGTYSYVLYAFTRVQEFETDNGYKIAFERIIASDGYTPGGFWTISLYEGDTEIEPSVRYLLNGKVYFIVNDTDEDGKIIATKYYVITLVEVDLGVDGSYSGVILPYESATVEIEEIRTVYNEAGNVYIDIDADGNIRLLYTAERNLFPNMSAGAYLVTDSSYDEETGVWTFKIGSVEFTATVSEDGVATIEIVAA